MIQGKFTFDHHDNYDAYLKAANYGMIQRTQMAAMKPDVLIDVNDEANGMVTIEEVASSKIIKVSFQLGEVYDHDPGSGIKKQYVTVLEGADTLLTREVDDPSSTTIHKVTENGLVISMTAGGVTATRSFVRIE